MLTFLMSLVVMRLRSDIPHEAGGTPEQNPPYSVKIVKPFAYATAYYWDMYGAEQKITYEENKMPNVFKENEHMLVPNKEENHGLEQAKAQYASICDMVAALEVDYDRMEELRDDRDEAITADDPYAEEWSRMFQSSAAELSGLMADAGDCENQDAARDRIQEDPLSVEVRSGWYSPGDGAQPPEEFQILLCTGGPAVRIMGELDEYGTPTQAWMEYQDWYKPWTQFFGADQDTLLTYCREFYFGGGG